jgi:drug/metabolite transporter (DMT)-like permease
LLLAYLCLVGICIIWGTTFLVMRIGVEGFPPFLFAGIRQTAGGVILVAIMVFVKKVRLPSLSNTWKQAVAGFLMITMGNGLVSWAEVYIPSGMAAIICSMMPVWVIVINLTINQSEKPNLLIVCGVLIGLAGILIVFGEHLADFTNAHYRIGILLTFTASLTWALGSINMKRLSDGANPYLNAGLQMAFGGIWCVVISFFLDEHTRVSWQTVPYWPLLYLALVGSLAAFAMYAYLLTKLPLTIASLFSYVNPLVAVVLGWLVLNEKLNMKIGLAIVITLVGIYLVNLGYQRKKNFH